MATTESSDVNVNVDAPYSEMADKGKMVKKSKKIGVEERDYKVFCCGNSSYDLMVILICFLTLWGATAGFFVLLLHAALSTDTSGTALWIFFGMFFTGISFLGLILYTAEYEKELKNIDNV